MSEPHPAVPRIRRRIRYPNSSPEPVTPSPDPSPAVAAAVARIGSQLEAVASQAVVEPEIEDWEIKEHLGPLISTIPRKLDDDLPSIVTDLQRKVCRVCYQVFLSDTHAKTHECPGYPVSDRLVIAVVDPRIIERFLRAYAVDNNGSFESAINSLLDAAGVGSQ